MHREKRAPNLCEYSGFAFLHFFSRATNTHKGYSECVERHGRGGCLK